MHETAFICIELLLIRSVWTISILFVILSDREVLRVRTSDQGEREDGGSETHHVRAVWPFWTDAGSLSSLRNTRVVLSYLVPLSAVSFPVIPCIFEVIGTSSGRAMSALGRKQEHHFHRSIETNHTED